MKKTYFVSGHLDLTQGEFEQHYRTSLDIARAEGARFVVGDARGCDAMVQEYLLAHGLLDEKCVRVFHMLDKPRYDGGFPLVGGFQTDEERDAAMTDASDDDIAWVRPCRERSGTAKNLKRRTNR